ncbi:MAG: hypothetical protein ACXV7J_05825 [Methylomonas sp.]
MTIRDISKLVSITLAVILIGFAVSISWSLRHLDRAFASVEFFGQEKDKIFTQVSQPILSYLLTGEAIILGDIEKSLGQIREEVEERPNLSITLKAPFIALIDELRNAAMPELVAAGKLADPQELLINNERMLAKHLQTLWSYPEEAKNASPAKRQLYTQLVDQFQADFINLAEHYFVRHVQNTRT